MLTIDFAGATDIGRRRQNNEDTFIAAPIWDDRHILLVVIDGMGGESGGEVAAEIARAAIIKFLNDFRGTGTDLELIKRAITDANNEIERNRLVQPRYSRMGCVATAGIVNLDAQTLSVAHVGDSRLYRFGNGFIEKITRDHSPVGEFEDSGRMSEDVAMQHPRRHVINRYLGAKLQNPDDEGFIEAAVFPLVDGQTYLFCSDGLSDMLTSAQIGELLLIEDHSEQICSALIEYANLAGGKDNITVVVAQFADPDLHNDLDAPAAEEETAPAPEPAPIVQVTLPPAPSVAKRLAVAIIALAMLALGFAAGYNFHKFETASPHPTLFHHE